MRSLFLLLLSLFYFNTVFCQTSKVIAEYTYTGNKKQSIEEVEEEAINHAKVNALSKAGIKEHVKTYSSLYRRTENNEYTSSLTSNFFSEKQGAVTAYKIIAKSNSISEEGLPICYVKIKASVIKYETDADYNYKYKIDGLSKVYSYNNEKVTNVKDPKDGCVVTFSVQTTQDTYLTIFLLWDNQKQVYKIFPDSLHAKRADIDMNTIFKKHILYQFGDDPELWLDAEGESTDYSLLIVMHKEERIFQGTLNKEKMWEWIFEIPRNLRYCEFEDFTVYKSNE